MKPQARSQSAVPYSRLPGSDMTDHAHAQARLRTRTRPGTPRLLREGRVDRSSIESDSSVPGMTEDRGSVISTEEEHHYRVAGDHIWNSFWQPNTGRKESVGSQESAYPALVASSSYFDEQQDHLGCPADNLELCQADTVKPLPLPKKSTWSRMREGLQRGSVVQEPRSSISAEPIMRFEAPVQRPTRPAYTTMHTAPDALPSHAAPRTSGFRDMFSLRSSKSTRDLRSGSSSSNMSALSGFSTTATSVATAVTTPATSPVTSPTLKASRGANGPTEQLSLIECLRPEPLRIVKQPSLPNLGRGPSRYRRSVVPKEATYSAFPSIEVRAPRPLPPVPFRHAHPPGLPDVLLSSPPPRPSRSPAPPAQPPLSPLSYEAQFRQQYSPPMISVFDWDSDGEDDVEDEPAESFAKRLGRAFTRNNMRERETSSGSKRQTFTQSNASEPLSVSRSRDSEAELGMIKVSSGESWKPDGDWDGRYERLKHVSKDKPALKRQGSAFFGKILGRK